MLVNKTNYSKKGNTIPITLVATMIMVLFIIAGGFLVVEQSDIGGQVDIAIEEAQNATERKDEEVFEFCVGENRRSKEPVEVTVYNNNFGGASQRTAHITDVPITCNVPGSHETGSGCLLYSFIRTQWARDGCEDPYIYWIGLPIPLPVGVSKENRGWYKFNFSDPVINQQFIDQNKIFTYKCGLTNGARSASTVTVWPLTFDCYRDYRHYANTADQIDKYIIGYKMKPDEELLVNSYFWDMVLTDIDANPGACSSSNKEERCGYDTTSMFTYCDRKSYRMYEGNLSVTAYVCCPPSGLVKGPDGHKVYDEAGNPVSENWYWNSDRKSCCLGETCINKDCYDAGGVWMYGRCWFIGDSGECNSICEGKTHASDGTQYLCKAPEWGRLPKNSTVACELHENLGITCNSCIGFSFPFIQTPPFYVGTTCNYYNPTSILDLISADNWCSGTASFRNRLCACM